MILDEKGYVGKAETVIVQLKENKDKRGKTKWITTSKIRNLLSTTADIYNDVVLVQSDSLPDDICTRIEYLQVRFVYESGRDPLVKKFVEQAQLVEAIKEIKGSRKQYIIFSRYMEALVAYHRYHGGQD